MSLNIWANCWSACQHGLAIISKGKKKRTRKPRHECWLNSKDAKTFDLVSFLLVVRMLFVRCLDIWFGILFAICKDAQIFGLLSFLLFVRMLKYLVWCPFAICKDAICKDAQIFDSVSFLLFVRMHRYLIWYPFCYL